MYWICSFLWILKKEINLAEVFEQKQYFFLKVLFFNELSKEVFTVLLLFDTSS